jgi:hypothetical protein
MTALARTEPKITALIRKAMAALDKATTAAEVLDAIRDTTLAYDLAKELLKMKGAHDEIVAASHRMMGDALLIITQAQCRLADEYDAAQERGEVIDSAGGNPNLPNRSHTERLATVIDIGLTRKQVHEARLVRDAEKKTPGTVQQAIDKQLAAGKPPTKADVKRAISKPKGGTDKARDNAPPTAERARVEALNEPVVNRSDLSLTAQQKFDAALRRRVREIYQELEQRFRERQDRHMKDYILPHYNKLAADAEKVIKARRGVFSADVFRKILACLHPDNVQGDVAKHRAEWAFRTFNESKVVLCGEKEMPTPDNGLPKNWQEWEAAKAKATAERKAAYAARRAGKTSIAR